MIEPLISVIIPCYRQAHLVAKAVRSVLDQTYDRREVIVVDDGSPDDVPTALTGFGTRVRYVRQANAGLSAARNAGLAAASGDCCLFLDSDDWLALDALQAHAEVRRQTSADVTFSGWLEVDPDGRALAEFAEPRLTGDPFHSLLRANLAVVHCFVISREALLRSGGFDVTLRSCEDWELWIRLAAQGCRFAPVPGAKAFYLRYPGSMSRNRLRMYDSVQQIMRRWRGHHPHCANCRRAMRSAIDRWADEYFRWEVSASLQQAKSLADFCRALRPALTRVANNRRNTGHLIKALGRTLVRRKPPPEAQP
jgi:glycosyltransferase involved in cell wall biosynthesis